MSTIRLCCVECDRRDYDGVPEVPTDWFDFGPSNVVDDLLQDATGNDVAPHWHTHLAICPDCMRKGKREVTRLAAR